MSKELEALQRLKDKEEEIKSLKENLDEEPGIIAPYEGIPIDINLSKKLKVVEIIKNKFEISKPVGIDIENNKVAFGCLVQKEDLTIPEYDLLKEVLL